MKPMPKWVPVQPTPPPKWAPVQPKPPPATPQVRLAQEVGGLTPPPTAKQRFLALVQSCIDKVQVLEEVINDKERQASRVFADWHHWGLRGFPLLNDREFLGKPCCLCMTSMGRNEQIMTSLPIAIWVSWYFADVTLYLVDFNQDTVLEQWVLEHLALPIEVGKLKFYRCPMAHWHASVAKNTAHMAACLDVGGGLTPSAEEDAVLVNLDGDNLFTVAWLRRLLTKDGPDLVGKEITIVHYNNIWDSGTYGRLACLKSLWLGIRGYDMQFLPMGCQDTDLKLRLSQGSKANVRDVKGWEVGISIPNAPPTGNKKEDKKAQIKVGTPAPPSRAVRVRPLTSNDVSQLN